MNKQLRVWEAAEKIVKHWKVCDRNIKPIYIWKCNWIPQFHLFMDISSFDNFGTWLCCSSLRFDRSSSSSCPLSSVQYGTFQSLALKSCFNNSSPRCSKPGQIKTKVTISLPDKGPMWISKRTIVNVKIYFYLYLSD